MRTDIFAELTIPCTSPTQVHRQPHPTGITLVQPSAASMPQLTLNTTSKTAQHSMTPSVLINAKHGLIDSPQERCPLLWQTTGPT